MNKIRAVLVGAAIVVTTLIAMPLAAAAEPAPPAPEEVTVQADGRLYVYYGFNRTNLCGRWLGHSPDWGRCFNRAASLWNNGYPGNLDDVLVFWDIQYNGAYRGVHNGVVLNDLQQWTFDRTDQDLPGEGEWLYNNIASHLWVNL